MSEKKVKYDEDGIVILDDDGDEANASSTNYEYREYDYVKGRYSEDDSDGKRSNFKVYNLAGLGKFTAALITIFIFALLFLIGFLLIKLIGIVVFYFFPVILVYLVWRLYLRR